MTDGQTPSVMIFGRGGTLVRNPERISSDPAAMSSLHAAASSVGYCDSVMHVSFR